MSLLLHVDADRWRAHLRSVVEATPGLVPVIKGNGYGFGRTVLAAEARDLGPLGVDTVAVGTYDEVPGVAEVFPGDLLVLTPWRSFEPAAALVAGSGLAARVVHTVSRREDLHALTGRHPDARYVVERMTSMRRHGMSASELRESAPYVTDGLAGVAVHLPMTGASNATEARRLMTDVVAAGLPTTPAGRTVWVSHLAGDDLAELRSAYADFTVRPRVGTGLWLGDRSTLRVSATVLDVHPVERGEPFGYRGRQAPRAGAILVVSGGTAHGIGLESPSGDLSLKSRAATIARGGLDAVGFVRSPYSVEGKQRLFAEPPHMQASMLFVPTGPRLPAVGDEIDVRVRFTATDVDEVVFG